MKKAFLIYHTDIWQSCSSHRVVGISETLVSAIVLAIKDKDAVADVVKKDGHIVIYEHDIDKLDSEKQVFSTSNDKDRDLIMK